MSVLIAGFLGTFFGVLLHIVAEGATRAWATEEARYKRVDFKTHLPERKVAFGLMCLLSGAGTALCMFHFGTGLAFLFSIIFWYSILILTFVDLAEFILPDFITIPLIFLGIMISIVPIFVPLKLSAIGAIAGYGSLWLVNTLFRVLRNKEGMGYGDFKLFAAIGAWVGPFLLPLTILIAAPLGILFAVLRKIFFKIDFNEPFPFGPMLAIGGFISLLYGVQIVEWYTSFLQP